MGAPLTSSNQPRSPANYVQPSNIVLHNLDTGNTCNPTFCQISEENGNHLISTVVTFTYPTNVAGKTCYLGLPLGPSAELSGSMQTDVFQTWAPVETCPSYSSNRGNELGRLNLVAGGDASWAWTSSGYMTAPTPCPAPGTVEGYEFAPVWGATGDDWVLFVDGSESARIQMCQDNVAERCKSADRSWSS
ncbi:hypothetical protein GQ53DRAFT_764047 [Thozetella sp. PMI_491]|nr:hypothetical protein GQ53DRAFT_764047 [Thozetella sp. PMI_491]